MDLELGGFLLLTFFQLGGGITLLQDKPEPWNIIRWLVLLLLLNGVISGLAAMHVAGSAHALVVLQALDVATTPLMVAAILARRGIRRLDVALLCIMIVHMVAAYLFPAVRSGWGDLLLRAVPYYLALSWLMIEFSRGEEWERWLALAFIPRALYFGLLPLQNSVRDAYVAVHDLSQVTLLLGGTVALVQVLRRRFPTGIALPFAATGPLFAVASRFFPSAANLLVNFLTLGLLRPLLMYVALSPTRLSSIALQTAAATSAAVLTVLLAEARVDGWPAVLLGLAAGFATQGALEGIRARRVANSELRGTTDSQPVRVLLALRGSSTSEAAPRAEWTQQSIALRADMDPRRVGEAVKRINQSADRRIARHAPGIAAKGPLLTRHVGLVPGVGIRVYYRLTPAGEAVAEAVETTLDRPKEEPPARGPHLP